jgi:hypothetical protein
VRYSTDVVRLTVSRAAWPSGSRGLLVAIAAVLVAVQAAVLFGVRAGEIRELFDPAELAPSIELYGDRSLLQTFVAHADGLTAITLYPVSRRGPATGRVELTLEDGSGSPIARETVPAAAFLARPEWTWTFAPVPASARQRFGVRVAVPEAAERGGLSLTIGPPEYVDGVLSVGGRVQWGDLRFQTRSRHARVIDLLRRRPGVQRGPWVGIAACAAAVLLAASLAALAGGLLRDRTADPPASS